MEQLVEFSEVETCGRKVLKQNQFFQDLCNLMQNVEFAKFYDNYFQDWTDIECMVFYMKLYSTIQFEYQHRFQKSISDETMTYMLHKIMTNAKSRSYAFDIFKNYKKDFGHASHEGFRKHLTFDA